MLVVFDDMIADMLNNKTLNPVVNESFIRGNKLNIYLFIFYAILFCCSKNY